MPEDCGSLPTRPRRGPLVPMLTLRKKTPPSEIFAKEDPPPNSANSHHPAAKLGTEVIPSMNLLAQSSVA